MVNDFDSPTWPPKTRPPQTAQELRTAILPLADGDRCCNVAPLMVSAELAKPMNGMKPDPDAFLQSAQ